METGYSKSEGMMAKRKKLCQDCEKPIGPKSKRCRLCANRFKAQDPEWRRKVSVGTKASYTPELRQRRSEERCAAWERGCYGSDEWRQKQSESHAGKTHSEEHKRKIGKASARSWAQGDHDGQFTEEVLEVMAEKATANWAAGVYGDPSEIMKARWERGCFDHRVMNPSSLERKIAEALNAYNISYAQQYRIEGDRRSFDFFIEPNVLVEVDGEYWHSRPGRAEQDKQKTELAKERGFTLARVPERAFKELGPLDIVRERILPLIGETDSLLGISSR